MAKKKEGEAEVVSKREVRAEEVRKQILEAKDNIEGGYMTLAQLLYETWTNKYYDNEWGYETFEDWCKEELNMKYRTARYLVIIAQAVNKHGLKWERVVAIGWTKMRSIAPMLTDENAGSWLEQAEGCTADQLLEVVKRSREAGQTSVVEGLDTPRVVTVHLRLSEDEASIIFDAVERAKSLINTDSITTAFEHIAYEWIQQSEEGPKKTELAKVLRWIERTYGVSLEPKEGQDIEALLGEDESE